MYFMSEKKSKPFSIERTKGLLENSVTLFKMIWKERSLTLVLLFCISLLDATLPSAVSWSMGNVINVLVSVQNKILEINSLLPAVVILTVLGFALPLVYLFRERVTNTFWFYLERMLMLKMFNHRAFLDVATYEDPKNQNLLQTVNENGIWRAQGFIDRQYFILENIISAITAAGIIAFANPFLFVCVFLATLPELFVEMKYGRNVWNIFASRAELKRKFFDVQSHITNSKRLTELKLFQNTKYFVQLIQEVFDTFKKEELTNEHKKFVKQSLSLLLSQGALAFATTFFIYEVAEGTLAIGTLTFLLASMISLRQALSGLFRNIGKQYQDSLFVTDMLSFLALKPILTLPEKSTALALPPDTTPEIVFENVTFKYPDAPTPVLKNFSLTIRHGDKVALVGVNGAGKTTFVKLLCRFYEPTEGRILIGGKDLRTIDIDTWHAMLGVLFQDYSKYNFLVKETIALGNTRKTTEIEAVKKAAHAAEADVFIEEWEKSYDAMLGNTFTKGVEPSIGQWQKLALARTFYRDPRVLVLDEPTAAIDAEAEARIFEKLEALPSDRTVLLISHRFSTVRNANQICVIKDGELHEHGTHEALLAKNGTYAKLFHLQAKGYQ